MIVQEKGDVNAAHMIVQEKKNVDLLYDFFGFMFFVQPFSTDSLREHFTEVVLNDARNPLI